MNCYVVTISFHDGHVPETRVIWSPLKARDLEQRLLTNVNYARVEFATVVHFPQLGMPKPGDVIQVAEGKWRGCVLTLLAITPTKTFVCRNDSYGRYEAEFKCPVIRTRAVEVFRRPQIQEVERT